MNKPLSNIANFAANFKSGFLNIHPVFDKLIPRSDKEKFLHQKACALWFTGLSGSGKSTIAIALEKKLMEARYLTMVLDGDNVRSGINSNLGFSEEDRTENIRRIAEVNKLFLNCGIITINCFVSPTRAMREQARTIIGDDFIEVFIDTPIEICEQRDVKGLYQMARKGEIKNFTGIHEAYEAPENPEIIVKTENRDVAASVEDVFRFVLPRLKL